MQYESYARSVADNARVRPLSPLSAFLPSPHLPPAFSQDGGSPILPLRAPSVDALIDLENRLADYAGQFRDKAKELVSGLERSPDLDMKFLAVRLNFNYNFRTSCFLYPAPSFVEKKRTDEHAKTGPEPTGAKSEA